uniref:Interferon-related developmental regulator N-terminal domain-containing protein n=1 Tax=Oryza punctata TaxID=4537 RepID=A0A0E0JXD5_ORYPU
MVLKKFTGRSSGHASTSHDDADAGSSSAVGAVAVSAYQRRIRQNVTVLEKVAVSVHDSRASTREAALAELIVALEGFLSADHAEGRYSDEILRGCYVSIKKRPAREACLALRAVALLAVTLGPGATMMKTIMAAETTYPLGPSKKIMKETYPLVSRILEVSADASLVVAALECLAVVAFVDVAAENMDDTEKCMNALWAVICPSTAPKVAGAAKETSLRVLAAAVSAWTLVLTTTGGWKKKKKVSPDPWRGTAAYLVSLLHSDSREVRMAAGEALAVTIEMKLLTEQNNGALFSEMESRASDLAIEAAGAGVNKTKFLEQKELFKNITKFLASGKAPVSSVRTSSSNYGLLTTSTWTDIVRLNFLRRFLGGGFLHHLQGKGLMDQVFVIDDGEITGKLSAAKSKRSLRKDTRIVKELNGGGVVAMDEKEKKQQMIKKSLEKQKTVKKERLIAYELKHGLSDL